MKQRILFIGLLWALLVLAGCQKDDAVSTDTTPMSVPTIHPLLGDQPLGEDGQLIEPITGTTTITTSTSIGIHISNVEVIQGNGTAVITWNSDAPALGKLSYGRTEQYELGDTEDQLPLLRHAVTLENLEAETTYHYRIVMAGNEEDALTASFDTRRQIPVIDLWYGTEQTFGKNGTPQRWINILGNVSDLDEILSLTYSLNGAKQIPLSIGPNRSRLDKRGDFNVDIARTALLDGENELILTATDTLQFQEIVTVTINYVDENKWYELYQIDWQAGEDIQEVVEVIDGVWEMSDGEVRITKPGYQRALAIGDIIWTDYEISVPITVHEVQFIDGSENVPSIGFLTRWTGHTDLGTAGSQPKSGLQPFGVLASYRWDLPDLVFMQLEGNNNVIESVVEEPPEEGVSYIYKLRVETVENNAEDAEFVENIAESMYRFKVWKADQPEPATWSMGSTFEGAPNGSFLLFAHHVDASFGEVTVTALAPPTQTPSLPNIANGNFYTFTSTVTGTLSMTNTVPITGTTPITETSPITGTSPITETSAIPHHSPITPLSSSRTSLLRDEFVGILPVKTAVFFPHHA